VIVLLLLVTLGGGALRASIAIHHVRVDYDEGRYLDNAAHILRGNGFLTSTVSCYFDDPPRPPRPEDISSPFYPYLLAGLFAVTGASFTAAKVLSVILGTAAIPLTFLLGRRLAGGGAGLIAATALAFQPDQVIVGAWAMTEGAYSVLVIAALLCAAPFAIGGSSPPSSWRLRALGLAIGLLYLMRQNGAAVAAPIAALIAVGPLSPGERRPGRLALAVGVGAIALVVCVPWFSRNVSEFGSPTFSRMRNIAWAAEGRSLYTPGVPSPSLHRFMEEQGVAGLASSFARRTSRVTAALFRSERGPFRVLSFLALLAPILTGLRALSAITLPPVLLSSLMFLGVAPWSGALPRYFLPLRPLLYIAGAAVLVESWRWLRPRMEGSLGVRGERSRAVDVAVLGAGLVAALWAATTAVPVIRAYLAVDQSPADTAAREAAAWIAARTKAGDVLLEGGSLHQYAWLFDRGVVWIPFGDLEALFRVADHYDARYVAITPEVLRFRPALARQWRVEGRAVRPLDLPDSLTPLYEHGEEGIIIYGIGRGATGRDLE